MLVRLSCKKKGEKKPDKDDSLKRGKKKEIEILDQMRATVVPP